MSPRRWPAPLICLLLALASCEAVDHAVETTWNRDYMLQLKAVDPMMRVGDQSVLILTVRRRDSGSLGSGFSGVVTLTCSSNGQLDAPSVNVRVTDDLTREFLTHVVFRAKAAGTAEVQATFVDATAAVRILISEEGI